jgi:hypothetical protein
VIAWLSLAWAGPEIAVERLLDADRPAAAQRRCEQHQAWLSEAPVVLREVCAEAMWIRAAEEGTFAGWVKFQQDWAGTRRGAVGREMEATVRLNELGDEASEADYSTWLDSYATTGVATRARELQARAAIGSVRTLDDARRVAREYPDAAGLEAMLVPWFEAFVHLKVDGERVDVRLEPEVDLPGSALRVEWAGRLDGKVLGWDGTVLRQFDAEGVPRELSTRLARGGDGLWFPPCSLPGVELGIRVTYGTLVAFFPRERPCGNAPPVYVSEQGGVMVALSPWPRARVSFPVAGDTAAEHQADGVHTRVVVLGEPTADVWIDGEQVLQAMKTSAEGARIWLARPLAGGLPWYTSAPPGESAFALPPRAVGAPVVDGQGLDRELPPGRVLRWSPLLQELLGLNASNPALKASPTPAPAERTVAAGEPAPPLIAEDLSRLGQELAAFGIEPVEAWRVALTPDLGLEVVFRGSVQGAPVKGVFDPLADGGTRVAVWFDDLPGGRAVRPRADSGVGFGWTAAGGRSTESLRVDGRGLIRGVSSP